MANQLPKDKITQKINLSLKEPIELDALCSLIETNLADAKGLAIKKFTVSEQSSLCDYVVIATGTSNRHVAAMAKKLITTLKKSDHLSHLTIKSEGLKEGVWVVIDLGAIIVHLLQNEAREYYRLDELY